MNTSPTLRIGEVIDRFAITDILPAGGQGEVYRAKDLTLNRDVALKLLLGSDPHDRERFVREAQTAAKVSHQNVVKILQPGTLVRGDNEIPYLVMEFIDGKSLNERLRDASRDQLLRWLSEVADGLAALHRNDVVHRDLKPKNIMIGTDDNARIIDLGLAKTPGTTVTSTGKIVGTADYLSPEQAHGYPATYRSDIFAFGIILYEALKGKHPFRRASPSATVHRIAFEPPDEYLFGREGEIVARCLHKDPKHRYDDAADLARDLRELQPTPTQHPLVARSAATVGQDATTDRITTAVKQPSDRQPRRALAIAFGGFLLLAAIIGVYELPNRDRAPTPSTAPATVNTATATPSATTTSTAPQSASLPTCGLSASPGTINPGGAAELRWSSTNAADVVISPDVGMVPLAGSIDVSPRVTTTYEIAATNADGVVSSASVTVNVANSPTVFVPLAGSFAATPDTIRRGGSTTLKWNSFHASRVVITPNIGIVPLAGSIQVSPPMTTTYTLTLTNDNGGFGTGTAVVKVEDAAATAPQRATSTRALTCASATQPGVTGTLNTDSSSCFVPDDQTVTQATLTYILDDGGRISINGRSVFTKTPREGSREGTVNLPVALFEAGNSFVLRVEARNALNPDGTPDGEVYGKAVVHLIMREAGAGLEMSVSPGVIWQGEPAHLRWSSINAPMVALNPLVGMVAPSGTMTVSPKRTTTYVLRGWSASGDPATARATVTVQ